MNYIKEYGTALSSIGAAIAFAWTIFQWLAVRAREARNREYQTFHELMKALVAGSTPGTALPYVDQQAAALFELRNYPRYFPYLRRTLDGLQASWASGHPRVLEELKLTKEYIDTHEGRWYRRLRR